MTDSRIDVRIQKFLQAYPADCESPVSNWSRKETVELIGSEPQFFTEFVSQVAAPSHGQGTIKFLSSQSTPSIFEWNAEHGWKESWPMWKNRLVVFAYDWNGSMFCFDLARKSGSEPLVSILEPDTGELLQTPHSFADFLGKAALEEADAALSASFYQEWRDKGGDIPKVAMCVGCKVPAFLNGSETVDNLALQPLEVYVSLCGQMYSQVRELPSGTRISGVKIG